MRFKVTLRRWYNPGSIPSVEGDCREIIADRFTLYGEESPPVLILHNATGIQIAAFTSWEYIEKLPE